MRISQWTLDRSGVLIQAIRRSVPGAGGQLNVKGGVMKGRPTYRRVLRSSDVCQCFNEWPDEELEELTEDDFEDLPCPSCGGRVVYMPVPVWMAEEEDDC